MNEKPLNCGVPENGRLVPNVQDLSVPVDNEAVVLLRDLFEKARFCGYGNPWAHPIMNRVALFLEQHGAGADMYGVKVVGRLCNKDHGGWVARNITRGDRQVSVILTHRWNAEKCKTVEDAEELAFLLATQRPEYMGRIRIKRLRPKGAAWVVDNIRGIKM